MIQPLRHLWATSLSIASLLTPGIFLPALFPQPGFSAEDIEITVVGPMVLSIAIEDLETFAETGEVTDSLLPYARFIDDQTLALARQGLTRPIPLGLTTISHVSYSPLGRDGLFNLGKVLRLEPDINGFYGLRAAFINAAANHPEGWTLLDGLKEFPTSTIHIRLKDLLALRQQLAVYISYRQSVVDAIQAEAAAAAATQSTPNLTTLETLDQPGPYSVVKETLVVENPAVRQTASGLTVNYDFPVDVYLPDGLNAPAPIVIISHGFGDVKESFAFMAEHLASYGFVAILPDHVGSDLSYRQEYLSGRLNTLLSPMEFVNRPQEISFLIDELERLIATSSTWADRLNLDRIGIMGDSLGGTTALSLAGAELNYLRLTDACNADNLILNFALYLECRARFLPPQNYNLRDDRIKAVMVTHPLGGFMYGPEGMGQIEIPFLMVSGSNDIVSPVVTEQVHPFVWVSSASKYLALLQVGTHFSSKPGRPGIASDQDPSAQFFNLLTGGHRDVGTRYSKILSIAFWQTYLRDQSAYLPYLTASYGQAISAGQPMRVDIIQSLQPEQLEAAYGQTPPVPIIPPPVQPAPAPRNESILAEIQRTGVLTVAFRKDAPPFGFINQANEWDGYCGDMAIALSNYLSETLQVPGGIQLVELTSTLQNRFDLVTDSTVHLECGPNTIRQDIPGVTFSIPISVTGAKFLVPQGQEDRINPNLPLEGVRLGVLQDSTTETFVRSTYPRANIVTFSGAEDRTQAIQALRSGDIQAFVGDSLLSLAELRRQNLPLASFSLIPEYPLTCEYYGFVLPDNDPEWKTLINQFISSTTASQPESNQDLRELEYCLNR